MTDDVFWERIPMQNVVGQFHSTDIPDLLNSSSSIFGQMPPLKQNLLFSNYFLFFPSDLALNTVHNFLIAMLLLLKCCKRQTDQILPLQKLQIKASFSDGAWSLTHTPVGTLLLNLSSVLSFHRSFPQSPTFQLLYPPIAKPTESHSDTAWKQGIWPEYTPIFH